MRALPGFFILAYGLSWLIWAPLWLPALGIAGLPVLPYHHEWGAAGPILAALVMSALTQGPKGPAALLRALVVPRGPWPYLAAAIVLPGGVALLALVIERLFLGGTVPLSALAEPRDFPGLGFAGFLAISILTFGVGEEVGWRGFALPRLQQRLHPILASLVLTLLWALWHWPAFLYRPGYSSMGPGEALGWLVSLFTGAVILTWLFNRTRGSLLAVALFHGLVDVVFTSKAMTGLMSNLAGVLITLVGIGILVLMLRDPQKVTALGAAPERTIVQ